MHNFFEVLKIVETAKCVTTTRNIHGERTRVKLNSILLLVSLKKKMSLPAFKLRICYKEIESRKKKKGIQCSFVRLTSCSFLFSLCFIYSLLWNHWPELVCKYATFLICFVFLVCCCHWFLLLFLILCDIFVSATCKDEAVYRYGLLARFPLYVAFTLCVLNILIMHPWSCFYEMTRVSKASRNLTVIQSMTSNLNVIPSRI